MLYSTTNLYSARINNFVYIFSIAVCSDPGQIENGESKSVGQIGGVFYVGSSIEYSCNGQHYLKGEKTISCTMNGTWSDPKPVCIKGI